MELWLQMRFYLYMNNELGFPSVQHFRGRYMSFGYLLSIMELKTFKKNINDFLVSKGFSKKRSFYYLYFKDITIVIGLQKSNFTNGYYLNIGYVITTLQSSQNNPRDVDGDVRARFSVEEKSKRADFFDLETLGENDQDRLRELLEQNIKQYVEPVASLEGLKNLLKIKPVMLYQTKLVAK